MANSVSVYTAKNAAALANPTSASVFLQTANSANAASVYFDPFPFTGLLTTQVPVRRFIVRAWGRATSGTTSNFLAKLQYGVSVTSASNTDMFSLTNRSYVSASGNWFINFDGIWDNTTQKINGNGSGNNLATIDSAAAITAVSSVDMTLSTIGLSVSALFGTSNASNVAYLDGLTLELL